MQALGIVVVALCRALGFPVLAYKVTAAGVMTIVSLFIIWRLGWWTDSGFVNSTNNAYGLTIPLNLMFFPLVFYGMTTMMPQLQIYIF